MITCVPIARDEITYVPNAMNSTLRPGSLPGCFVEVFRFGPAVPPRGRTDTRRSRTRLVGGPDRGSSPSWRVGVGPQKPKRDVEQQEKKLSFYSRVVCYFLSMGEVTLV